MHGASRESFALVRERLTTLADTADAATLQSVADGLAAVVRLLDREGRLRRTLGDPTLHGAAKDRLLQGLLGDQLAAEPMALLLLTAEQRWSSARDLVDAVEMLSGTATFLLAEQAGELDRVTDELFRFGRTVTREPLLRSTLTDRALADDRKTALLDALLEGKAAAGTRSILATLVLAPRGRTIEDGLAEYAAIAAEVRKRALATVTTAIPLDEAQRDRLTATLSRQLGRQIQVQTEVDTKIIGGVLVRLGDEVIDGSVLHRLAQARRAVS